MRAALVLAAAAVCAASSDVYMAPTNGSSGPDVAIIWIQGASIPAEQYKEVALALQKATAATMRLWVGIPEYPLSIAEPVVIGTGIERVRKQLHANGVPSGADFYAAAHSAGGPFLQMYIEKNQGAFKAVVMMGSFISRKSNATFTTPTMTIGGELDGLARITRIAQAYELQTVQARHGNPKPRVNFPTVIIGGMTHMQFASGAPPLLVRERDLQPEISEAQAHSELTIVLAAYLESQQTQQESAVVARYLEGSIKFFTPILAAFELEGSYLLKPACNCDNPIVPPFGKDPFGKANFYPCFPDLIFPWCRAGAPWGVTASAFMGGLDNITYNVTSAFHPVTETKPESNLPHIFNNCSKPGVDCTLTITTVNQNTYDEDPLDTGFFPQGAKEIRAKMMSRQNVYIAAGLTHAEFNVTDSPSLNLCAQINQKALDWALQNAAPAVGARYKSKGQLMVMGDDYKRVGPLWIYTSLNLESKDDKMVVSSPYMSFPHVYPLVPASAGFHYCKLLSPARALEWVALDSMRLHHSLNNKTSS